MTALAAESIPVQLSAEVYAPAERMDRDQRQLLIALAAAVALHLAPVLGAVGWVVLGGGSRSAEIGDPSGSKDGVNVEVIDAAEFDKRFVSFGKGRDAIDSTPPPAAAQPPPQPAAQPTPEAAEQQQPAEPVTPLRETRDTPGAPAEAREPPAEPKPQARPAPRAPPTPRSQLTEADIEQILAEAKAELQGEVFLTSAASGAKIGEVSPYVRGVMRRLKASMPRSNGVRGAVIMGIVLGDTGEVAWAGVLRSSGHPQLDRLVIERVRATRFDPPPPGAQERERKFQVTYVYQ